MMDSILSTLRYSPINQLPSTIYEKKNGGHNIKESLDSWITSFPIKKSETGGILKIHEYAENVLKCLKESPAFSKTFDRDIATHLRDLSRASDEQKGQNYMFDYFFTKLPEGLTSEGKETALWIRSAMLEPSKKN